MRATAILAVVLAAVVLGCGGSGDRAQSRSCALTPGAEEPADLAPAGTPSTVSLGPGMELTRTRVTLAAAHKGKPLVLTGVVRGRDCRPLAGATLHAWQTNGDGRYGPGFGEGMRCCYLQGTARTDAAGRYELRTVVPGGYAGSPSHIHFRIGHPRARSIVTELLFARAPHPVVRDEHATTVPLEPDPDLGARARFDVTLGYAMAGASGSRASAASMSSSENSGSSSSPDRKAS